MSRKRIHPMKMILVLISYFVSAVAIIKAMDCLERGETGQALIGTSLGLFLIIAARKGSQ